MRRILFLLPLFLVGCSKGKFNDRLVASSGVLTYPLDNKVTTIDPGKVQDSIMPEILGNVYEGLVAYDEDNKIAPALATHWDITDGGKTYVFHLREAQFHDGKSLTADDFRWTWERNLGKSLASPIAADYLGAIVGVKDFVAGKAKSIAGIQVIDDNTLSVTIDKPRPYFLGDLTYPCAFALSRVSTPLTEIRSVKEAIGTGPFEFSRVAEDSEVDLNAFNAYWGGMPKVLKISRPVMTDGATRLSGFRNGQFDLLFLPRSDLAGAQADPSLKAQLRFEPRPSIFYFIINQDQYAPFRDVRVRRAFAMSLNRKQIVEELLPGEKVANGLIAPGIPGYRPDYPGISFDPSGARALLAAAGFPDGKGLPPLELDYRANRPDSRIASEAAATAWRKELNAPVTTKALELGTLLARRNHNELQLAFMNWGADYLDPQNFLSLLLTSTSKLNHDGFRDKDFDRICAEADVDPNPTHRMALYGQAETLAIERAARLPLYFEMQPMLVSKRVTGLRENLFGVLPHTKLKVNSSSR